MTNELDKAAKEYATHASKAPDKETPDWIITDFKAGAKYEKERGESFRLLDAVVRSRGYVSVKLRRQIINYLDLPF